MTTSHDREIGMLTEAVNTLKESVESLRADVNDLKTIVAQIRGSWKTISGIGAAIGALVTLGILKISPFITLFPK
jgi:prefoldin subunit 5